ncbi:MAG: Crp/Fnr family transcriptional regulator [Prevotella sp.]|nr:Crp/Fnr family transcriptional regulator [Prevotella sp.]
MPIPTSLTFYDSLLRFRLFQGMSRTEMMQLAGNTKFGFLKEKAGKTVATADRECQQLLLLTDGSLTATRRSDDGGYSVTETVLAPWPVQPEALFGAHPRYTATWRTRQDCSFITLQKDEVLRLLDDFLIIRLNLLNLLSTMAQRTQQRSWRREPQSLRERFVRFVMDHAMYPAGQKEFRILMRRIAAELGDSRLDTSRMLNSLQDEGLLTLHRGRIVIPSLEVLVNS